MASEIFLNRFDKEMKGIPITETDWKDCESKISELKLVKDETGILNRIDCFCKSINDWIPVFWIDSKGNGFMSQSGFFKYDESYEKAIEIAENMKGTIWVEDGFLLFEPNVGVLYDNYEPEDQPNIGLDDLVERKVYFEKDIKKAIQELIKEKGVNLNKNSGYEFENDVLLNKNTIPRKSEPKKEKNGGNFGNKNTPTCGQ